MANVQGNGDLSVFSIGGNSLLALIKNVEYELSPENADTTTILRAGKRRQKVKAGTTIRTALMSTLTGDAGLVSSNLAVGAFTIGGVDLLAYLRGGSFNGTFDVREVSGVAAAYKWPQIFGKDYTSEVTLVLPAAADSQTPNAARSFMASFHDPDLLDQDLTRVIFSITIDGTATTVPMIARTVKHQINGQQEQVFTISLEGNDPGTGAYPTAPVGTTSLLEAAFNAYNAPLAAVLTTGAALSGETYSGNVIITSFGFNFNDAEIIEISYEFASRGTFAAAAA